MVEQIEHSVTMHWRWQAAVHLLPADEVSRETAEVETRCDVIDGGVGLRVTVSDVGPLELVPVPVVVREVPGVLERERRRRGWG